MAFPQHRDLPVDGLDGTEDQRQIEALTGPGHGQPGGQVVHRIHYHVAAGEDLLRCFLRDPQVHGNHFDHGVEVRQSRGGGSGFGGPQGGGAVEGLALQVAFLHDVVVDDDQPPHSGSGQVLQHGPAETSRPDAAHRCGLEPALGLLPETVDGHGPLVAVAFGFGEGFRSGDDRLHQLSGRASRMTRASSPGSRSGWVAIASPHR